MRIFSYPLAALFCVLFLSACSTTKSPPKNDFIRPALTMENMMSILELGMKQGEVDALIGRPDFGSIYHDAETGNSLILLYWSETETLAEWHLSRQPDAYFLSKDYTVKELMDILSGIPEEKVLEIFGEPYSKGMGRQGLMYTYRFPKVDIDEDHDLSKPDPKANVLTGFIVVFQDGKVASVSPMYGSR